MGWLIALGIMATYGGIGLLCVPFITRRRLEAHREGSRCGNCDYGYSSPDERTMQTCAKMWASYAWLIWPLCLMVGLPKNIATGTLAKDAEKAKRLRVLEVAARNREEAEAVEAAEREKGVQRELAILRSGNPLTMTKADFDRKMLEADPKPAKRTLTSRLANPFG